MPRRLPDDHTPAAMTRAADSLLAECAAGEPAALARIAAATPRTEAADVTRSDVEHTLALEHGFASWRQLMVYCAMFLDPDEPPDFLRLACVNYFHSDRSANYQRARDILAADPELGTRDIWHAACVGDVRAVRRFLDADPESCSRRGGYFDWPPLLYACYSRLNLYGMSTLEVAMLLVDRGADPNAHYMWGGTYRFTALTGAYGEGEMGPVNQPPHEARDALARFLLEAGADANDSQALYNTMFTPGSACLKMLLEYGLGSQHRCNWLAEDGDELVANDQQTLGYQLEWAARNHHEERARILIDCGAVLTGKPEGRTLYEWAWLTGHPALAELLAERGAETIELGPEQRFAGLCMSGANADAQAARSMLRERPGLIAETQAKLPNLLADAVASDRREAVATMLALGFDPGIPHRTPLHQAAFHGRVEMARLLLDHGADLSARDNDFAATPLQWAMTAGQRDMVDFLATQDIGIFDAVLRDDTARIAALLDAAPALLETTIGAEREGERHHSDDWQTPLAFAALRDRAKALALLVNRGARTDLRDDAGQSLVDLVRDQASVEALALLGDSGPAPG